MNKKRILDYTGGETEDSVFLSEVARRIEQITGTELSLTESLALMEILFNRTIEFVDGFYINKDEDLNRSIDAEGAAAVVASILDTDMSNWSLLGRKFSPGSPHEAEFTSASANLLRKLREANAVITH